jgi:cell division protein FtsI (penicillin-binding protein 3)
MEKRVNVILVVFLFLMAGLCAKAFHLQVLKAEDVISRAYRKFEHSVNLSPSRGIIYDRRGHPLAISLDVKSIAANPRLIKDHNDASVKLARALDMDRSYIRKRLGEGKYFAWIKRQATPDEIKAVEDLKIKGIGFFNEKKRFYPESEALSNILGFVGVDGNGLEGLELQYDHVLKGMPKHIEVEKDGLGRIICAQGVKPDVNDSKDGNSLGLTIDKRLQYISYAFIKDAVESNNAKGGFVIITNPHTGEIYSMASYPGFDPNIGSYRNLSGHHNRAITDVFEPGSVVKPIWVAWGLDTNYLNASQSVFCENGAYKFHHSTINDHEGKGWLTVSEVVKYSSNIGMVKLFSPVDTSRLYNCLKAFGFGSPTGIDFPGEPAGLVRNPKCWRMIDKATMAFGQGFAITGIQLITAFNSLVNGGVIIRPHFIDYISDPTGRVSKYQPQILRKVMSEKTSEEIVDIMKTVVLKGGTGEAAGMNNYTVFGKTGTAQKVDPLTRSYSAGAHVSSFIGGIMDSSGKPVMTMLVCIDEPHPYYYASIVTCPVFKNIAMQCTNIMDMRPIITLAKEGGRG